MDFDRSKHNVIKYLPTNNDENIWGMSINGIGFQLCCRGTLAE